MTRVRLFDRLRTGFGLARRSTRVLRDQPELLVFPVLGGLAGLVYVLALFLGLGGLVEGAGGGPLGGYGLLFVVYLGSTFLASYFTAGLMYCTRQAMRGEEPRVGEGLRAAGRNVGPLLAWAVVAAVVGVLIRALEDSNELVGRVVATVFSLGWTIATYFVVPVVVFEDTGLTGMYGRSVEVVRETWGESLGAEAGVGLVTIVLVVVGAIPGLLLLATGTGGVTGIVVLVAGALLAGLIGQALTGIAKTALYVYATEDDAPGYFEDMDFGGSPGASGRGRGSRLGGD